MELINEFRTLGDYKSCFNKLQTIAYRNININGLDIRVLGIYFMDHGPQWNVKKHRHSFFELHYVTENYVYTTLNNIQYKICPGMFYIMPPGTYHSHRQEANRGHIGFALRWEFEKENRSAMIKESKAEVEKVFELLADAIPVPVYDNGNVIRSILNFLETVKEGNSVLKLQLAFCSFLLDVVQFYSKEHNTEQINVKFVENGIVEIAAKFIHENFPQDIDVHDIANSAHMSYSHLARLFKKNIGETVNSYLNKVRLQMAQKLLLCSQKTLEQIAGEVGFSNERYLCTAFKKQYGVSPGTYRNREDTLSE